MLKPYQKKLIRWSQVKLAQVRHFSISPCNTVWDLLATHATCGLNFEPIPTNIYYVEHQASDLNQLKKEKNKNMTKEKNQCRKQVYKHYFPIHQPSLKTQPNIPNVVMLATPEFLFNFWEVLFFSPQCLSQRPGAAGWTQVLGFIRAVAPLLLIRIDVDAVQTSEDQQQSQDGND